MCVNNNTIIYVARASSSKRDCEHDLYCCLLPRCEALRTCHSGFRIATMDQAHDFLKIGSWKLITTYENSVLLFQAIGFVGPAVSLIVFSEFFISGYRCPIPWLNWPWHSSTTVVGCCIKHMMDVFQRFAFSCLSWFRVHFFEQSEFHVKPLFRQNSAFCGIGLTHSQWFAVFF